MSIKTRILDGLGRGTEARVEDEALMVSQYTCPPLVPQKSRIFVQYLTIDGLPGGTSSMLLGAGAVPQDFWVPADEISDRYITTLSFVIADDGADLDLFGAIAALANGCQLFYESMEQTVFIHETLQTNWDFVRMALGEPAFGTGAAAFKANNVEGKVDAFIPILDLRRLMPPYGVKLDRGTTQRMVLRVRDATNGIDSFNCLSAGFDRFE